ncbi:MAG TPA: hypothetical protein VF256_15290, partial [Streptosporangiaceae bacterium]
MDPAEPEDPGSLKNDGPGVLHSADSGSVQSTGPGSLPDGAPSATSTKTEPDGEGPDADGEGPHTKSPDGKHPHTKGAGGKKPGGRRRKILAWTAGTLAVIVVIGVLGAYLVYRHLNGNL